VTEEGLRKRLAAATVRGLGSCESSLALTAGRRTLLEGAARAGGFLLSIAVARYLGVEMFGRYALALAVFSALQVLAGAGVQNWLVVSVGGGKGRGRALLLRGMTGSCLLAAALWGVFVVLSPVLGYGSSTKGFVLAVSLAAVPAAMAWSADGVLLGLGRAAQGAIGKALASWLRLGIALVLLGSGAGLAGLVSAVGAGEVAGLALVTFLALRAATATAQAATTPTFWASAPYTIQTFLVVLFLRTDTLMLSVMKGEVEVGIYGAAYRLLEVALLVSSVLGTVALQRLSEAADRFKHAVSEAAWLAGLGGLLAAAALSGASRQIVGLLFGSDFVYSGPVLGILGLAAFPHFLNTVLARCLWARGRIWWTVRVAAVNLVLNIALNLVLVPRWGARGASVATLITLFVALGQNMWLLSRREQIAPIGPWLYKGLLAAAAVWVFLNAAGGHVHAAWLLVAPGSHHAAGRAVTRLRLGGAD
jgi:O-antigen/teichoic acid export membrane protein